MLTTRRTPKDDGDSREFKKHLNTDKSSLGLVSRKNKKTGKVKAKVSMLKANPKAESKKSIPPTPYSSTTKLLTSQLSGSGSSTPVHYSHLQDAFSSSASPSSENNSPDHKSLGQSEAVYVFPPPLSLSSGSTSLPKADVIDHREGRPKAQKREREISVSSSNSSEIIHTPPSSDDEGKPTQSPQIRSRKIHKSTSLEWKSDWVDNEDISVNVGLHDGPGIVAIKPRNTDPSHVVMSGKCQFVFGSRTLIYGDEEVLLREHKIAPPKKAKILLNELQKFVDDSDLNYQFRLTAIETTLRPIFEPRSGLGPLEPRKTQGSKPINVISLIKQYAEETNPIIIHKLGDESDNERSDIDRNYVEETFLPFVINRTDFDASKFGLKLYPWLSRDAGRFYADGFEQFAVELCMFGANMEGYDRLNQRFSMIKHDIEFHPGQQIVSVECSEPCFYETAQFAIFEKLAQMIAKLSNPNKTKKLYCHLPYYDYMLFGIELYIRGRITPEALEDFFVKILQKKEDFTKRLTKICEKNGIEITIESPFDNLFGKLSLTDDTYLSETILDVLELDSTPTSSVALSEKQITEMQAKSEEQITEMQAKVVQRCLNLVTTQTHNKIHQEVWSDFASVAKEAKEDISSLKELFKIANAVMVGISSRGYSNYRVCSLMPLSGKQIQRAYVSYSGKLQDKYPAIVNLTFFDPIITYSNQNIQGNKYGMQHAVDHTRGLAFYFSDTQRAAGYVIQKGLFNLASKNAATTPRILDRKTQTLVPTSADHTPLEPQLLRRSSTS